MTAILAALGFLAILIPLMPLGLHADALAFPDLLLPLLVAWAVRRPLRTPILLLAGLLLLADFALERPVGLWALISLLIVEAMRAQGTSYRDQNCLLEYAGFGFALALGLIVQSLILSLAVVPQPGAGVMVEFFALTILAYPVIVVMLNLVFRVRFPKPAERPDRLGRVR